MQISTQVYAHGEEFIDKKHSTLTCLFTSTWHQGIYHLSSLVGSCYPLGTMPELAILFLGKIYVMHKS